MHVYSKKFLALAEDEAEYEKENYKLELVEFSSENTQFLILPAYKY